MGLGAHVRQLNAAPTTAAQTSLSPAYPDRQRTHQESTIAIPVPTIPIGAISRRQFHTSDNVRNNRCSSDRTLRQRGLSSTARTTHRARMRDIRLRFCPSIYYYQENSRENRSRAPRKFYIYASHRSRINTNADSKWKVENAGRCTRRLYPRHLTDRISSRLFLSHLPGWRSLLLCVTCQHHTDAKERARERQSE